jgi:hypothetical protein
VYALFYLLFVAIIEYCKHQVEEHVQTNHKEANEEDCTQVVDLPKWEQDVWEVGSCETYVHVEKGDWHGFEVLHGVMVLFVVLGREQNVATD